MRSFHTFLLIVALALSTAAQVQTQLAVQPTTTLTAETANNTAAPAAISTSTNGIAVSGNISKVSSRSLLYSGANTKIYAAIMGWFGKSSHIPVGYRSDDPVQVQKQVDDMQSRGIDGAILAWYGKGDNMEDRTARALKTQAELHPGFTFAIMVDKGTLDWNSMGLAPTDALISHLTYVSQTYFPSLSYMRINGQPVVFEFGLEFYTIDWAAVRASVPGMTVIFRNPNGWTRPLSDGAYAWAPEMSDMGYLDYFYGQAAQYPVQKTFAGASKGFNDSMASWTENRFSDPKCGQTWLQTWNESGKYYSSANPLNFMQIATWNDYEEGTTIESGIDNCVTVASTLSGKLLSWSLSGAGLENTIDHYTVFLSIDGENLMPLANVPSGSHSLDLSTFNLAPADYTFYVKAVAKASLTNKMSNLVSYVVPNQPPVAALAVTPSGAYAPVTVSASTAAASDPDGTIASSQLDFGDGTVIAGPAASHAFQSAGTYTITATVTDNLGASAATSTSVNVSAAAVSIVRPVRPPRDGSGNKAAAQSSSPVRVEANAVSGNAIDGMSVFLGNVSVYSVIGSALTADVPMRPGLHDLTVDAADVSGAVTRSSMPVNVLATGVFVTSPVQGGAYGAPLKVTASARSSKPIVSMIVYVDNVQMYKVSAGRLSTTLNVKPGNNRSIAVKAWDSAGKIFRQSVSVSVH